MEIGLHNLRDYSTDKHHKVDDYPFSAGAGMVMMIEPVDNCITHLKSQHDYDEVIYMSPDGELLTQPVVNQLSLNQKLQIQYLVQYNLKEFFSRFRAFEQKNVHRCFLEY